MKIAVTATGNSMDAELDPRFGRCSWFIIVETDNMSFESVENINAGLTNGAGIQSVSLVSSLGVQAVLTGQCGPKATQAFAATDIKVYQGCSGIVRQAVEQFLSGTNQLTPISSTIATEAPTTGQANTTAGDTRGRCMGGTGRGMGMGGGGRGMGGGGRGMGGGGRGMGGGQGSGNRR